MSPGNEDRAASTAPHEQRSGLNRREFIKAAVAAGATAVLPGCALNLLNDNGMTAATAILRARYDTELINAIEDGFDLVPPPDVTGKRVLLKPNLVDLPRENKPIVTNPAVVIAAAEAFRRRGAAEVLVGDGSGLQRDIWQIVDAVGLTPLLAEHDLPFVDLSTAELTHQPNAGRTFGLDHLYFPRLVWEADVLVSMPKMKAHHWAGASLAMKNLMGTLPGLAYGWPRNAIHRHGLHNSIVDINLTRPADYAIIDGIVGLEGNGPVCGTPIDVGVLVMGSNAAAVDATASRIMGFVPERIQHFRLAAGFVGPIGEVRIEQRGETIASVRRPFQVMPLQRLILG
jgi:uncharacterized protein (DUF362 family)